MSTCTGASLSLRIWCAGRPAREEDDVARRQLVHAVGVANGRRAVDDQHPLLLAVLVVIRAQGLARRQLVEARAGLLGADLRAEAVQAGAKAVGIVVVVGEGGAREADALHGRSVSAAAAGVSNRCRRA